MTRTKQLCTMTVVTIAMLAGSASSTPFKVENLARQHTGSGLVTGTSDYSSSASNIANGKIWHWSRENSGLLIGPASTRPRYVDPYLTWDSSQEIASLRLWQEGNWGGFTPLEVYSLNNDADPTLEASWTLVYSNAGPVAVNGDVITEFTLPNGPVTTAGIRLQGYVEEPQGSDGVGMAEVAIFSSMYNGGTLTDNRIYCGTNWTQSSAAFAGEGAGNIVANSWMGRWQVAIDDGDKGNDGGNGGTGNPGDDYWVNPALQRYQHDSICSNLYKIRGHSNGRLVELLFGVFI